jgi:hypothetical protein
MKSLLTLIVTFVSTMLYAQVELPLIDSNIVFEEIIPADNIGKGSLFDNIKLWFANSFQSSNDVIQSSDKESGYIIGKGTQILTPSIAGSPIYYLKFSIRVDIKDNKFRFRLYDFLVYSPPWKNSGEYSVSLSVLYKFYRSGEKAKQYQLLMESKAAFLSRVESYCLKTEATAKELISSIKKASKEKKDDW